ncbi:TrkH family potassium uptake protein [Paracoccus aestuarii]|uniref:TrkH family potassium uptake protein n=1 Tax=Paracoccus aestuarii TaxID=453842 RepID=A0A418ZY93_9RHOB|nr:chromate transporter [Paracoccus aestuarii]RJL05425.1 TrkH family potassium uptake protein [Paracoccus aestuarii]
MRQRTGTPGEVFGAFLKLGLTSFGGPVAHLGYFRDELVTRRRWMDDRAYADLVALCQFMPGPASSQVGFALGLMRAGWWGALAAFAAFTLPSAILMLVFALTAASVAGPVGDGVLVGLKIVAVAIVAQAVWGMARSLCPDPARATIAVAAVAILAPLRVGGFEIMSNPYGREEYREALPQSADPRRPVLHLSDPGFDRRGEAPSHRLAQAALQIGPVYAGLTLALWVGLLLMGDPSFLALMRAMGTLSTSGISPVIGPSGAVSGIGGEVLVFLFLIPALSRRFWPGGGELRATDRLSTDPELRMALSLIVLVSLVLFLRHFLGAIEVDADEALSPSGIGAALAALWGGLFSALSYLTTTGWTSVEWAGAQAWSGLSAPGLILAGLAMMGGGIATTAGGVKLLRVYALARHGQREMERIIHPHSVSGGGRIARRLRREGAYLAFIFFMLFAISIALVVTLVSIHAIEFETATILSIAALTNAGPLAGAIPLTPVFEGTAGIASAPWEGWSGLPDFTKAVLAAAMVLGRIETLAVLALMSPEFWRR